jgi:hypothetical protein
METDTFGDDATVVTYDLQDDVRVHGPYVSAGLSWRRTMARRFHLGARATMGLLMASSTDPVSGSASTGGPSSPVFAERGQESVTSVAPFLVPELFGGMAVGRFELGLSLAVAFFPANGPTLDRGRFGAQTSEGVADPSSVLVSSESDVLESERAYSRFVLFVPGLSFGGTF